MVTLKTARRVSIVLLYILLHTSIMNSFAFARFVDPVHNVEPIESSVSQAVYSVTDQVYKTIEEISNSTDIRSPKDSYIVGFDSKTELVEYLNTEVISHEHIDSVVNMNAVAINESDPVDEINTYNLIDAISIQLTDDKADYEKLKWSQVC